MWKYIDSLSKERIGEGTLKLSHINSRGQIADCVTKGFGVKECSLAYDKMRMLDIYHPS
jgi:hypothetical protein